MADEKKLGVSLDKSISIGHVLTTASMAVAAITWGNKLDARVDANTLAIKQIAEANVRYTHDAASIRSDLMELVGSNGKELSDKFVTLQNKLNAIDKSYVQIQANVSFISKNVEELKASVNTVKDTQAKQVTTAK